MNDTLLHDFFGSDLTEDDMERLALERVNRACLKREADLFATKWFDYRRMHHVKATYLFAEFFRRAIQAAVRRYDDMEKAPFVKGHRGDDILALRKADITGFWKARQAFDERGIPYGVGLAFAMSYCFSYNRKYTPRPAHLYHPEMLAELEHHWTVMQRARIYAACDPWFGLDQYIGHRDQDAHQEWLIRQVEKKAAPQYALSTFMVERNLLDRKKVAERLGEQVVTLADEIAACPC